MHSIGVVVDVVVVVVEGRVVASPCPYDEGSWHEDAMSTATTAVMRMIEVQCGPDLCTHVRTPHDHWITCQASVDCLRSEPT